MQKFQLELFFRIIGIGSASGLFFHNNSLFLISDSSRMLYEYRINEKKLDSISLVPPNFKGDAENIAKAEKPDFEAIAENNGDLYLFGSGSTEKRNTIVPVNMATKQVKPAIDATDLYIILKDFGEIDAENFNIEAAVNDGTTWYLFNRGNGPKSKNGVFTLNGDIVTTELQIMYNEVNYLRLERHKQVLQTQLRWVTNFTFWRLPKPATRPIMMAKLPGPLLGGLILKQWKWK